MKKFVISSILIFISCTTQSKHLTLSQNLSPTMHNAFINATNEWALAGAFINIDDKSGDMIVREVDVIITNPPQPEKDDQGFVLVAWTDKTGIQVKYDIPEYIRWQTAAHELGHFLGAVHTKTGLMSSVATKETIINCIDSAAANQLNLTETCTLKMQ